MTTDRYTQHDNRPMVTAVYQFMNFLLTNILDRLITG
jgi:hypothetical protein